MIHMEINIEKEFTTMTGSRNISDGDFSGEYFRGYILEPKY